LAGGNHGFTKIRTRKAVKKAAKRPKRRAAAKKAAKARKPRIAAKAKKKAVAPRKKRVAAKKPPTRTKAKAVTFKAAQTDAATATLLHRWFEEVWNKGSEAAIDELLALDAMVHGLPVGPIQGPDAFKQYHRDLYPEFSDLTITLQNVEVNGDEISADCSVVGTHKTGKSVNFTGNCRIRVANDRIVEGWNDFDFDTMSAQISAS
jgi:predicted ester cyclase